jgi:hypothetical protein
VSTERGYFAVFKTWHPADVGTQGKSQRKLDAVYLADNMTQLKDWLYESGEPTGDIEVISVREVTADKMNALIKAKEELADAERKVREAKK